MRLTAVCLSLIWVLAGLTTGFENETEPTGSRPGDPWVFAGALDDRPRVLFVTLDHELSVAYDTQLGDVYKAWRGTLVPAAAGALAFSPWPATVKGLTYVEGRSDTAWRVIRNGEVSIPEVKYRGYRISGDRLTISYQLITEYGYEIDVEESPEIVYSTNERPGLQRTFFLENVPKSIKVALDVEMKTLKERTDVQTDGVLQRTGGKTHTFVWGKTYDVAGRLVLNPGTTTTLTTYYAPNLVKNLENAEALDPLELFRDTRVYKAMDLGDEESASSRLIRQRDHVPGAAVKVYGIGESIDSLMHLAPGQLPTSYKVEPAIDLSSRAHFGDLDFYFITHVSGVINVVSAGQYRFRVLADDGVRFSINNQVLYEHNGLQAATPSDGIEVSLTPGVHPFAIEHFQSTGQKRLTLEWMPPWSSTYEIVKAPTISTKREDQQRASAGKKYVLRQIPDALIDIEQIPVDKAHPGLAFEVLQVPELQGSIGDVDVLSDGRLVATTWDGSGAVYAVEGVWDPGTGLLARPIAKGLSFPFGVKAIDDEIFVLQKHELTQLIDLDGDRIADEFRVVANDWPLTNDFDEYAFGLTYFEGQFFAGLAMPVDEDGAILIEEIPERGHLIRIGFDASVERIASGLQMPNGIELDESGQFIVVDHRNPWFSDSRLVLSGNNRRQRFNPSLASQANPLQMSSIWLPSGAGSEAPTQPVRLTNGAYEGQWIYGDLNDQILNRVFVEEVNGVLQGAVFRYSNDLPFPVNRIVASPDGRMIAGGIGFSSQWRTLQSHDNLLLRIDHTEEQVFEMAAVQIQDDGFEITFSQPVKAAQAGDMSNYRVYVWNAQDSGRRQRRDRSLVSEVELLSVAVADDGTRVRLELQEMRENAIYYINLVPALESEVGDPLWSNEAWYSVNVWPNAVVGKAGQ